MLRTKIQQKSLCTNCPIAKAAHVVGDTVTLIIVRELLKGPMRFGDISEVLGVSTRTLTLKLKQLEAEELLTRKEYAERPPRVEYALTKKGKALKTVITALSSYGAQHL